MVASIGAATKVVRKVATRPSRKMAVDFVMGGFAMMVAKSRTTIDVLKNSCGQARVPSMMMVVSLVMNRRLSELSS